MPSPIWTHSDVGCHIEGSRGLIWSRRQFFNIVKALEREFIDNGYGGTLSTTEYLQSHTAPGLVWQWLDGDLILLEESEVE